MNNTVCPLYLVCVTPTFKNNKSPFLLYPRLVPDIKSLFYASVSFYYPVLQAKYSRKTWFNLSAFPIAFESFTCYYFYLLRMLPFFHFNHAPYSSHHDYLSTNYYNIISCHYQKIPYDDRPPHATPTSRVPEGLISVGPPICYAPFSYALGHSFS